MTATIRLAGVLGLTLATSALLAGQASASTDDPHPAAVFVQTDNPDGNAVVAYDRSADGTLRQAGSYQTGGRGGVLNGSVVDHLASQGSLALDRDAGLLYAVNAGSDTITVFDVRGDRLAHPQVISSGGTFPVSIAVHRNLVYVLNARDGGSLQGYLRVGESLLRVPAWHRDLGFTHTPGQVAFTPDGRRLVVTTKANGNQVDVFPVGFAGLGAPAVTVLPGAVPFAVAFDAHRHLVVAEAGPNAVATFTVNRDDALTAVDSAATGQAATCWIVRAGTRFYLSNAGSGTLSGYRDNAAGTLSSLGNTATDPGTVDAAVSADAQYLYVQTGATGTVDGYLIHRDGSLTPVAKVTVPDAIGAEGIVAT